MAVPSKRTHFVLEDSFLIKGRGWVLAPALEVDAFPANTELVVELVAPDGQATLLRGHFYVEHLRLVDGGSRWNGVVVLNEFAEKPTQGSQVRCAPVEDEG
jgi:hypothetical protein